MEKGQKCKPPHQNPLADSWLFICFHYEPPKVLFLIIRIPQKKKKKSNPREINTLSCSFTDPISPKLYVLSSLLKRLFIFQENTSKSDLFHFLRESKVFIFPVLVQTHQNREFEQKGIISNDISWLWRESFHFLSEGDFEKIGKCIFHSLGSLNPTNNFLFLFLRHLYHK